MVYDNLYLVKIKVSIIFTAISAILLAGCGATPALPNNVVNDFNDNQSIAVSVPAPSVRKQVPLLPTLEYIPVLKADKKGKLIPYKPAKNPYLSGGVRVSREDSQAYKLAKQAFIINDLDRAKQQLNILRNNKKLSGPWVLLGDVALKEEALEQAEAHYLRAIAINNRNVNAFLRLAKVQRMQGKFSLAQNTYAEVLAAWSDFPEAHLNLGVLYDLYLNDPVKAQKHIEAYQFLTNRENTEVAAWLRDLQRRTGMKADLGEDAPSGQVIPVS